MWVTSCGILLSQFLSDWQTWWDCGNICLINCNTMGTRAYWANYDHAAKKLFSRGSHLRGVALQPQKSVFITRQNTSECSKQLHWQSHTAAPGCSRAPESDHRQRGVGGRGGGTGTGSLGLTCISSSFDWMSGGKSAAPQVNGSNGSAPNRSLSAKGTQVLGNRAAKHKCHAGSFNRSLNNCSLLQASEANDGQ